MDAAANTTRTASRTPTCPLRDLRRELRSHLRTVALTMMRTFIGVLWDASRQLPGHVSDVARQLPGSCADAASDATPDAARKLRDHGLAAVTVAD